MLRIRHWALPATAAVAGVAVMAALAVLPLEHAPDAIAGAATMATPTAAASGTAPTQAPIVRDNYTVTVASPSKASAPSPSSTSSFSQSSPSTAAATAAATPQLHLECASGEEAIPIGDNGYVCGDADLADPADRPAPLKEPVTGPAPAPSPVPASAPSPVPVPPAPSPAPSPMPGVRTVVYGDLRVTQAGTVLDRLDVHGRIIVQAANVTIRNSVVRGLDAGSKHGLVDNLAGSPGLVIEDSEIAATVPNYYVHGIMGYNFTLRRVNIHSVVDQVHLTGGDVIIVDSWLHSNLHWDVDPNHADGTHDDNVQIQAGTNISIINTRFEGSHNAGIQITQDRGKVANVTVRGNTFHDGGCSVNIAEKSYGYLTGISIVDNVFGRTSKWRNCPVIITGSKLTVPTFTGNLYTDGVVPVVVYRT